MIQRLKQSGRLNITLLLIGMSLFCFGISMTRYIITETKVFLFLNWNLFLAFIPWLISTVIVLREMSNKFALVILILTWLLFFPNSPYILTDLFHLRMHGSAPIWFDLVVILSFAWTGLVYGFRSLMDIEFLLKKYLSKQIITFLTIIFMFIASFGIYLGRYLRWNSWDIVSNPFGLFNDVFDRILNPMDNPRAWGMTVLMGILLNMMYFSIKFIKPETQETI
jgi:uncharacterized membrane protein